MALGKNLKRKKLISAEEEKTDSPKKSAVKKRVKKKALITESKAKTPKKSAPKKQKKVVSKKSTDTQPAIPSDQKEVLQAEKTPLQPNIPETIKEPQQQIQQSEPVEPVYEKATKPSEQKAETSYESVLPLYIAKELRERKNELRKRYAEEIKMVQDKTLHFVSFEIAGESYAIDIDHVREIVQLPKLSNTPNTPNHIKGIANVRGNTYVVFDIAARFHISGDIESKYLLIIHQKGLRASLLLPLLPTTFKTKGGSISSEMTLIEDASLDISFIKGIIQYEEQLIYYLDVIEMLKNDKAMVVPDTMLKKGA